MKKYDQAKRDAMLWHNAKYAHYQQNMFDRVVTDERKQQGIDCAKLVRFAIAPHYPDLVKQDGARWLLINISRLAEQYPQKIKKVDRSYALQNAGVICWQRTGTLPSDFLTRDASDLWNNETSFSVPHVALSLGDGTNVIHATGNSSGGVPITSLWSSFTDFYDVFADERIEGSADRGLKNGCSC